MRPVYYLCDAYAILHEFECRTCVLESRHQPTVEDMPMTSLAVLRRRKLLTQRQLAERAQVAPSTIYVLEAGRRTRPRFDVLQKIARALEVDVEEVDEFRRVIEGQLEAAA